MAFYLALWSKRTNSTKFSHSTLVHKVVVGCTYVQVFAVVHLICTFPVGPLHPKDEALLEEEMAEQPKSKRFMRVCVCVCVCSCLCCG